MIAALGRSSLVVEVERLWYRRDSADPCWHAATGQTGAADLVLVFAARTLDVGAMLAPLRARYPSATILGCSTAGEIHQGAVADGSAAAMAMRFANTPIRVASAPVLDDDASFAASFAAGASVAAQLAAPDLRAVLVFSDGLFINGSGLARGLRDGVAPSVVVTGGLAGDGEAFTDTWVLWEDQPRRRLVTAVGLYGDAVHVRFGSRGGWDIFGPPRIVTRAEGSTLYELDGHPALALYKRYLGERANGLPAAALLFPLAIHAPEPDAPWLVRTVLGIDESMQSLRFAGDIPNGSVAQLMRANVDHLVTGAAEAALSAAPASGPGAVACIAISCIGRRLVLKGRIEEELEAVLAALPSATAQVGMYAYGELSPVGVGGCDLHNQTMTLTTITEGPRPT